MRKSIIVFACFSLLLLSACSRSDNRNNEPSASASEKQTPSNLNLTGFPITTEKITLDLMGEKAPIHGPWDQMYFFQEMEKKTNIHFEFDTPARESYKERKNLAFASGEYPDLFFGGQLDTADEINYGQQGILIPLEDLIEEYAPNLKKFLEENPDVKRSITTTDGHIYALPNVNTVPRDLVMKPWINGEWLANLNISTLPATTDDLLELLRAFRDGDPNQNGEKDEIPLSAPSMTNLRKPLLAAFGLLSNSIEVKDDKIVFSPIESNYQQYLKYMNVLFNEKLLDSELFSQTTQQFTAKGKSDRIGVFVHAAPHLVLDISDPADNAKHPALPVLTSEVNSEKVYPLNSSITRGTFAITKKNKYPEATMRWVDYFYSPEGSNFAMVGDSWQWKDADQTQWEFVYEGDNKEEYRGKIVPDPGLPLPLVRDNDFLSKEYNLSGAYLNKVTEEQFLPYAQTAFPLVYFTEEEQDRLNVLNADITTYVEQMEAKFIFGQTPISEWDNYVATIQKMGVDDMISIYQAAYDRWKSE
ncbi:extracellular solute-binding protein [Cohnella fermenti]|nr:extracellular solute-binding protein [Cohnella fermenti]